MKVNVVIILLTLTCLKATQGAWADVVLVENGQSLAQVVMSDDAPAAVRDAAADFVRVIHRMSGAKLELVQETKGDPSKPKVLIGVGKTPSFEADPSSVKCDAAYAGYVIACEGNVLALRGNSPAGTANAVYGFLLDELGVRWFLPTDAFEIVPQRKTVRVPKMRRVVTPSFVCRLGSGLEAPHNQAWARRNRWDTGEGGFAVPYAAGFTHWMYALFPPSKHSKSNPDIYPLIGGKRAIPQNDGEQLAQPCTGNPETVRIAIETINTYLDAHPATHTYPFSINDNNTWCECELCRAQDAPRPHYRGRQIFSDRWFAFVNAVAKGVRQKHPDKFIGCFAYAGVELPPLKIERLEPNVFVNLTQDTAQYFDSAYRKVDYDLIVAWQQKCDRVGKYDYYGLGALAPRYFPHLLADDLKAVHEMGARAFHSEVYPYWANTGPMPYLAVRLLWDVDLDPDKLLKEFYAACFGPAAKEMRAFYELHEKAWMSQWKGKWFGGISSAAEQMDFYSAKQVSKAAAHLKKAESLAQDDATRTRIQFIARGYAYPDLLLRGWSTSREAIEASVRSSRDARSATQMLTEIAEALEEEESVRRYSIVDDPIMAGWYAGGGRPTIRAQWRSALQRGLAERLQSLAAWFDTPEGQKASPQDRHALDRLAASGTVGLLWQALQGTLHLGPNLLPNPGFEEAKATTPGPAGPEWKANSVASGWSTWQQNNAEGAFFLDANVKHSGKSSGAFKGGECLCYIITVPIQTGKTYLADAWVLSPSAREGTNVTLEVRWNDAQGRWFYGAPDHRVETKKSGEWERLLIPFAAPEGAVQAVILLVGYGIEKEDVVRFDDTFVGEATTTKTE